ncbi:DUF982 domain-containing protein [Pseudochrobactrum asaccharolyticum]|jgi:hypothetical protein|uniref:Uncharacterized protein DUF982 n=1 Tax=Pseudochrobactrum asaccharolyticum TaxID=354351 RepID=A0A366EA92_9HYPH|nr:DUF982 domain-containing protein [Pseudochrobactrum asaccharolyticum]MBX8803011.1 DUF982 domain-containing protein [Ochrobactrum sp. MR28]MBX8818666.1 DUF982 domain-containing protein [Ochrobactrum sp. MR31]MDR2312190.1 DUF982 domain-containing protein [Brucellaceae bacterium]RBO99237.1 uncharacterized protein DUF982 [Pseudochrobactrum asaccharolyticum]
MNLIYWDEAVIINIADGITHSIGNIADAENFMLSQWERFDLDSMGKAITACLTCSHDSVSTQSARLAFEQAAEISGLLA